MFPFAWSAARKPPLHPCLTRHCSRLAITTKIVLDQVLGGVLWHAALMAVHEPYREAAVGLWERATKSGKEGAQVLPAANRAARKRQ